MTRRDLREFAKQPGVFKDAVRDILRDGPQEAIPSYLSELDTISDEETTSARSYDKVFVAWEYRGPLEDEEMQAILRVLMMDADSALDPELAEQLMDPLLSVDAAVWFCQGRTVKVAINHLDDNASLYNAFQVEKSDARLWGPGIAYLMRDQQNVLTDGWRAMLDNASFGARPMFEIDEMAVRPNEGTDFIIEPGAVFVKLSGSGDRQGVRVITIPIVQEHWAAILQLAMQFVDTETNISILAQGEQGQTSKTAGGMALLVNNMNIVFRRVIKEWDDAITSPILGKSYTFLMQFQRERGDQGRLRRSRARIVGALGPGDSGAEFVIACDSGNRPSGARDALEDPGDSEAARTIDDAFLRRHHEDAGRARGGACRAGRGSEECAGRSCDGAAPASAAGRADGGGDQDGADADAGPDGSDGDAEQDGARANECGERPDQAGSAAEHVGRTSCREAPSHQGANGEQGALGGGGDRR